MTLSPVPPFGDVPDHIGVVPDTAETSVVVEVDEVDKDLATRLAGQSMRGASSTALRAPWASAIPALGMGHKPGMLGFLMTSPSWLPHH